MAHSDEPIDVNYADHEFLNFRIAAVFAQGENGNRGIEFDVETDVLDLENDELGMLTWLNASLTVLFEDFPESGGEVTRGGAYANVEIGANLSGQELLSQASVNQGLQQTDEEDDVTAFGQQANDEPGLWGHLNAAAMSGYKDADPDGVYAGSGTADNDRMRRVYAQETSGGPYIDSTDDVNIGIYVDKRGCETDLRTIVYGQMAFMVMEYENRRQEFAPYDPA